MRRSCTFIGVIFFPRLSIALVDDQEHLSEVVFSALVGFSLFWKWQNRTCWTPETVTPTSSTPYSWGRVLGIWARPGNQIPVVKENPTRALKATLLKCCLPSTVAIDRREKIHACVWRFKVATLKSKRFSQKIKVDYISKTVVTASKNANEYTLENIKWS